MATTDRDALVKLLWDHAPEIGARPDIHVHGCSCEAGDIALVDLPGESEHIAHLADVIEAHYAKHDAEVARAAGEKGFDEAIKKMGAEGLLYDVAPNPYRADRLTATEEGR